MDKKKKANSLTEDEKKQIIKEVKHTFECEKMPLTLEDEKGLKKLLNGEKTKDELVAEEIAALKKEGLIKY
ncbi:MAG: hypothetical protein ACI4R8_04345 [Candidatus Caccovivens sp.]